MTAETSGVSEQVAVAPEDTQTFEDVSTDKADNIVAMRESMGSMKKELDDLRPVSYTHLTLPTKA